MQSFSILLADDEPAAAPPTNPFLTLAPIAVIGVFLYMLAIRPMRKQEKERKALLESIKKNDRVLTSGGIIGVIANIRDKDDEIVLKVDENSNVRIRVTRSSIVRVLHPERDTTKDTAEEKT